MEILPSPHGPTIAHLFPIGLVFQWRRSISEKVVRELIPRLQKRGAQGIIEYPLNKVILGRWG